MFYLPYPVVIGRKQPRPIALYEGTNVNHGVNRSRSGIQFLLRSLLYGYPLYSLRYGQKISQVNNTILCKRPICKNRKITFTRETVGQSRTCLELGKPAKHQFKNGRIRFGCRPCWTETEMMVPAFGVSTREGSEESGGRRWFLNTVGLALPVFLKQY